MLEPAVIYFRKDSSETVTPAMAAVSAASAAAFAALSAGLIAWAGIFRPSATRKKQQRVKMP